MTPNSNPGSPKPPDDNAPRPEPDAFADDDIIDLGHLDEVEEGSSALSFSGKSGPRTGGSSSHIRSWEELARASVGDSGDAKHDPSEMLLEEVDPVSDKDLLREVLADEPSPSKIVLRDPSLGEIILPPSMTNPKNVPFELPADLAASRSDDSSILSMPEAEPGHSGMASDVFGSSSRVDLLRPGEPAELSSGSMQHTDEMGDPPIIRPLSGDSSHTLLRDSPAGRGAESSAVDLGSHAVDLPFPLGLDSTVGSSRMAPARKPPLSSVRGPDSGTVDLLGAEGEFDLGLGEPVTSQSWEAAREGLPPTVPLVPAGQGRGIAWAGGGIAGLLVGVAACAGLWFAGVLPNQETKTAVAKPDAGDWPARAQAMVKQARDEEAAKIAAATAEGQKARDQLAQIDKQLAEAKAASVQAKQAQTRADALAEQVKQAEDAQAKLKESVDKLTAGKSTFDAKLREADAELSKARNLLAQADQDAKTAKDRLEVAEAAQKRSAALAAELTQRLRVAPDASPSDVLAALDRVMARPIGEPVVMVPGQPSVVPTPAIHTPEQARQATWAGVTAYRIGDASSAEKAFAKLTASPEANAVDFYFLGLAQWRLGKSTDADASFRRGWELERASRPPPSQVDAKLERLDRIDRETVNSYRR